MALVLFYFIIFFTEFGVPLNRGIGVNCWKVVDGYPKLDFGMDKVHINSDAVKILENVTETQTCATSFISEVVSCTDSTSCKKTPKNFIWF